MTRREFMEESGKQLIGKTAIAAAITGILAAGCGKEGGEKEHGHHAVDLAERRRALREALERTAAFRRDPRQWWWEHREELFLEDLGLYVVECVDEGDDIDVFLREAGQEIPPNFDVISVPGSGALYSDLGRDLKTIVGRDHIIGITSHRDCGACNGDDARARRHAQKLAREVGTEYLGHVTNLQRPAFHVALGSNLRYTPKIRNPRFSADAPRYFDTSQWCLADRAARLENIKLMLKIAYHHGFNELFIKDCIPYEMCVWYDPTHPLFTRDVIAAEVREAYQNADIPPEVKGTPKLLKLTFLEVE